jgi:Lon protease-like protein
MARNPYSVVRAVRPAAAPQPLPRRHNVSMPSRLLPLFPLQVVVFPRTRLPLHIFEDRYKEMVGTAIQEKSEFGIVLAKNEGIVNVGCTVVVEEVLKRYPDGRMDIITRGQRRFEILFLNEQMSFLRAEVQYFDDEEPEPAPPGMQKTALEQYRNLVELGESRPYGEADLDDPQLSFQLAQNIQDLDFLHMLLRNRSETGRLKEVAEFLERYVPRQRQVLRARAVAPLNGYGGVHPEH